MTPYSPVYTHTILTSSPSKAIYNCMYIAYSLIHSLIHKAIYNCMYIASYTASYTAPCTPTHNSKAIYNCIFQHNYICLCIFMHIYTHLHIYTNRYVYSLIHSPMHTYARIHTHTHTHTPIHTMHTSSATTNLTQLTSSPRLTFCCSCPAVDNTTCEFSSKFFCVSRESTYDLSSTKIIFIQKKNHFYSINSRSIFTNVSCDSRESNFRQNSSIHIHINTYIYI